MIGKRIKKMWDKDPFCALCNEEIQEPKDANRDHILPRSYGGCGADTNMQLTHIQCNTIKGNTFKVANHSTEWLAKHMSNEETIQGFYMRLLDEVKASGISALTHKKEMEKKDVIIHLLSEEIFRLNNKET